MKNADQAANKAPDEDISTPLDDLKKLLTGEDFKKRDQRWKNGNNEMKERKPNVDKKEDTKGMPWKEKVAICRFRTGYMPLLQHPSIRRPHSVGMQRN
jgi:hypothetical protein